MKNVIFIAILISLSILTTDTFSISQRNENFVQEVRTFFRDKEGLVENNVKDVLYLPNIGIVILTQSGMIQIYQNNKWEELKDIPFKPLYISSAENKLYIADEKQVNEYNFNDKKWSDISLPAHDNITDLYCFNSKLYVNCGKNILEITQTEQKIIKGPGVDIYSIAIGENNELAIGTKEGIYQYDNTKAEWVWLLPEDENRRWAPRDVHALVYDNQGNLWFGAKEGVGKYNGNSWSLFTGKEGLPWNEFISAVAGEKDDIVWFATKRGAIRYEQNKFSYRFSHRWLLNDHVNSIAIEPNGNAWFATPDGLSLIERKIMTLEEKSDYFIQQVEKRHNRDGYIAECRLLEPYNTDTWESEISDNDGLYTSMYGAVHAFRYAVTKDLQSKEIAKRSFFACKRLVDITGRGFPARVLIPIDWREPVNELMGKEYNARRQITDPLWKQIVPRFVTSSDGKYMWKCDTSSDELAGHYFFYGIYYDLVAENEEEKQPVREVVKTITDHLIQNNYCLIDHDGKPTRWAFFNPEMLHSLKGWEQRGLNSMMMLSFLRVAHHITGDEIYNEKFNELCNKYFYHINAMQSKMYFPPDYVVPWDNNLCLMSWFGIFRYENDPEKLLLWRIAVDHAWQHAGRMKQPFWNFLYLACAKEFSKHVQENRFKDLYSDVPGLVPMVLMSYTEPNKIALEHALETLKGIPLDLISYCMDNTKRLDVVFDADRHPERVRGWHIDGYALPIQELPHLRNDNDPFTLNSCSGRDGVNENEGTFFLLPYWMGVYYGYIN
ncbi:MAG TPA: hypothetical protein PLT82_00650 [Candidatus Hydrogenedens sp.]|nr:hypothetical protein [Candidatus Hydrogenedens sp.]HOL18876.1 hypothetical protein [Candidatus Hydrogenedens sp.]HPP57624.1 hypothetical protein [Candidatus Hydrogenedens sp.]